MAGNIGGLASTTDETPVVSPVDGRIYIEPTFEKAKAQGILLAKLVSDTLKSNNVTNDKEPSLYFQQRFYSLPVINPVFILATTVVKLMTRPFNSGPLGWTVDTESNVVRIGGLTLLTTPGELYPEVALGGLDSPPGADLKVAPREYPPLIDLVPGTTRMFVNTCNDFLDYLIPASQWDQRKPYITGTDQAVYGESNSLGSDSATLVHQQSVSLLTAAREATGDVYKSRFYGRYQFALKEGKATKFHVDRIGKITGEFSLGGGNKEPIIGVVKNNGQAEFWIANTYVVKGTMDHRGFIGRYEARGHRVLGRGTGDFSVRFGMP